MAFEADNSCPSSPDTGNVLQPPGEGNDIVFIPGPGGLIRLCNVPRNDPHVEGALYVWRGTLRISEG